MPESRSPEGVPVVHITPIPPWQEPGREITVRVPPLTPWPDGDAPPYRAVELPPPPTPGPVLYHDLEPYPLVPERDGECDERRQRLLDDSGVSDLTTPSIALPAPPRRRRWQRERYWYESLLYPLPAWKPLVVYALALALATVGLALMVPALHTERVVGLFAAPVKYFVVPVLIFAYGCGLLQCVLDQAVAGEPPEVCWPGWYVHLALAQAGRWLWCFLAGPAELAALALLYWLHCGDLDALDRLILGELGLAALGYWLFALLAVTRGGRLRDANPLRVAELMHRLGYRSAVTVVAAALLAYPHGRLLLAAVAEVHRFALNGFFALALWWFSALVCAAVLLRIVGLWCYRNAATRPRLGTDAPPARS